MDDSLRRFLHPGLRICDGLSRREALRAGAVGGLSLASLLEARQASAAVQSAAPSGDKSFGRAKSVILFFLLGGPSQHDTWDPKPEAPEEVRGEFKPIATRTPGLTVGELMPKTARLTDRLAVIRSMATGDSSHSSSGYQMLTGIPHVPMGVESVTKKAPNLQPCIGALVRAMRGERGRLPEAITIPEHIWNDGQIDWPGQDAGLLGLRYDPWLIHCDPSDPKFHIPALTLPQELTTPRFGQRRDLLAQLNRRLDRWAESTGNADYDQHQKQAVDMLAATGPRGAFDLTQESEATRDRYGRTRFGQSTLLARRLVEAGVSLVQVNWTRIKQIESSGWDTHARHHKQAREALMPMMDQTYSALIEDLDQRGLLDDTLVVWCGEFGRTPKVNRNAGRDHWGHVFSLALAGAGIRGGTVFGASDRMGGMPARDRCTPADLWATVFHLLGYTPDTKWRDQTGREHSLSRGQAIREILA